MATRLKAITKFDAPVRVALADLHRGLVAIYGAGAPDLLLYGSQCVETLDQIRTLT